MKFLLQKLVVINGCNMDLKFHVVTVILNDTYADINPMKQVPAIVDGRLRLFERYFLVFGWPFFL